MKKLFFAIGFLAVISCSKEVIEKNEYNTTTVLVNEGDSTKIETFDLPEWNMVSTNHVHLFTSTTEIQMIQVFVYRDDLSSKFDLSLDGGVVVADGVVSIYRNDDGVFCNYNFDDIGFSRGEIKIFKN